MVDAVFAEIELPALPAAGPAADWRAAMRDRAESARAALRRHPRAAGLLDSRSRPGPATLRHHDAVLGALRAGGFSVALATHAFSVIDSYLCGFVVQDTWPRSSPSRRCGPATTTPPSSRSASR